MSTKEPWIASLTESFHPWLAAMGLTEHLRLFGSVFAQCEWTYWSYLPLACSVAMISLFIRSTCSACGLNVRNGSLMNLLHGGSAECQNKNLCEVRGTAVIRKFNKIAYNIAILLISYSPWQKLGVQQAPQANGSQLKYSLRVASFLANWFASQALRLPGHFLNSPRFLQCA